MSKWLDWSNKWVLFHVHSYKVVPSLNSRCARRKVLTVNSNNSVKISEQVFSKLAEPNFKQNHLHSNLHITGYSIIYYFPKVKGCRSRTMHFWPYIGKAKMCLRDGSLLEKFVDNQLKNIKNLRKLKYLLPLKHSLALPDPL